MLTVHLLVQILVCTILENPARRYRDCTPSVVHRKNLVSTGTLRSAVKMAALLRRTRLIWENSQILGATTKPFQEAWTPFCAVGQAAPFSAAKSATATRGRKKAKDQEPIIGTTKDAPDGQLGDGHSTPSKPKRSPSAYSQYVKEQFPEMKKNSSGSLTVIQANTILAKQWKSLSEEAKQPYLATALAAKLANPVKGKAAKVPKKMVGYRLFVKENFDAVKARNSTLRAAQVVTAMAHEWKAKSQEERNAYNAKAEEYNRTLSHLS